MAWRGTPKISMASQYKSAGKMPARTKRDAGPGRIRARHMRDNYKRSGYATRFLFAATCPSVRQENLQHDMADYFQSAHLVSALVA
jgi:hypothetical protein